MGNKSGSFAGNANGNLPEGGKKTTEGGIGKSPNVASKSHSADPVLSAPGIGSGPEAAMLESRTHTDDGYEQVTPGHIYDV